MSCLTGDQIGHLWWRILNGELPKKPPKVFTILIGTNDLTAADCNMNQTELLLTVPGILHRSVLILSIAIMAFAGHSAGPDHCTTVEAQPADEAQCDKLREMLQHGCHFPRHLPHCCCKHSEIENIACMQGDGDSEAAEAGSPGGAHCDSGAAATWLCLGGAQGVEVAQ